MWNEKYYSRGLFYLFILSLKLEVYIVYTKTKLIQSNYQKEKREK